MSRIRIISHNFGGFPPSLETPPFHSTPAAVVHPIPLKLLEVGPFKLYSGLGTLKLNIA